MGADAMTVGLLLALLILCVTLGVVVVVQARLAHRILTQNTELQRAVALKNDPALARLIASEQALEAQRNQPRTDEPNVVTAPYVT